ncbi:unnamed protein product [Albugo candida]|uniref:Uncharacterized protein n=1 Tax=Albugo candida TaxID=65357 RepID=A0A024G0H3_9STRA|nr:unnamed protein product [Albugo candida]|eukprot:CCI40159.1 unnamed protein product [Albugo candida]
MELYLRQVVSNKLVSVSSKRTSAPWTTATWLCLGEGAFQLFHCPMRFVISKYCYIIAEKVRKHRTRINHPNVYYHQSFYKQRVIINHSCTTISPGCGILHMRDCADGTCDGYVPGIVTNDTMRSFERRTLFFILRYNKCYSLHVLAQID